MLKTLRNRFVLINMMLVGALLLTVLVISCVNTYSMQMKEIDRTLEAPLSSGDYTEGEFGFLTSVVALTDADGNIQQMYARGASLGATELKYAIKESLNQEDDKGMLKGARKLIYQRTYLGNDEAIVVFVDASRMISVVNRTILTSLGIFAVAMLVIFIISRYLAGQAIKPIQQTWDRQKQFIADASHELKTPITVILANGGILKNRGSSTVAEESQWVDSTIEEAGHMKKLVEGMLFLAKSDSAGIQPVKETTDLTEMVETDMLNLEPLAYEKGIELTGSAQPGIFVKADPTQIKQLIHILVDNAIKYACPPDEGRAIVEISLKSGPILSVKNTGVPIESQDIEHLFERFYRADSARTRREDSTGYGLGLAIAKTIADTHGAEIVVKSDNAAGPGGLPGTEFAVKF